MAANGTNQSRLRQAQGGSPRDRGSYERDQYYNRATSPNTINNQSGGAQNSMYSNNYNPMGTAGVGGQYGNQQSNLGRYRPPTMNGSGGWNDNGGYAYNLPNSYGATGLGYMSGLGNNMFNPWQGSMNPQMNYGGGMGFQQMLQGLMGRLNGYNSMTGSRTGRPGMGGGQQQPGMEGWITLDEMHRLNPHIYGGQQQPQQPGEADYAYTFGGQSDGWISGQQQPQNPNIGRDNRMTPGGGANIGRGRYPENPRVGGAGGGGISRPGGGATVAPSPVGGITNAPPQQPRLWWGQNGGG